VELIINHNFLHLLDNSNDGIHNPNYSPFKKTLLPLPDNMVSKLLNILKGRMLKSEGQLMVLVQHYWSHKSSIAKKSYVGAQPLWSPVWCRDAHCLFQIIHE